MQRRPEVPHLFAESESRSSCAPPPWTEGERLLKGQTETHRNKSETAWDRGEPGRAGERRGRFRERLEAERRWNSLELAQPKSPLVPRWPRASPLRLFVPSATQQNSTGAALSPGPHPAGSAGPSAPALAPVLRLGDAARQGSGECPHSALALKNLELDLDPAQGDFFKEGRGLHIALLAVAFCPPNADSAEVPGPPGDRFEKPADQHKPRASIFWPSHPHHLPLPLPDKGGGRGEFCAADSRRGTSNPEICQAS